jgi:type III pantothenate kinase
MNFVIDIGNSGAKIALYRNGKAEYSERVGDDLFSVTELLLKKYCPERAILSSVKKVPHGLPELIKHHTGYFHTLSFKSGLPIKISYKTPETLGPDRIAAVAGAYSYFAGSNILVIDAGTAITYEVLENDNYAGGNISPGIRMRFKALNSFTGALPLIEPSLVFKSPGDSTTDAIMAGVVNGVLYEINEYIRTFKKKYSNHKVILTGGDCSFISEMTGESVFLKPDLVTEGLNFILDYNAKQAF